ncbi:PREDICTED: uncharacterized protein LOC109163500 [Ipomoea nil]|uniref:uncharacterized protein LOC109163500 n=1 Tax=Ipomoea nil TaxID=35883 RepID=UPI0009018473|nr:PREDICTED: uncharacterized protein LOC109163500 [Ipomoea nil]
MASTATATNDIIQLNAPRNVPIKLTTTNFPVWRRQVHSTLIGLNLLGYIDGTTKEPAKFTDTAQTAVNPAHLICYRQDQIIVGALLGSCTDTIQPLISSATTAHDVWQCLIASYVSASRGRIISLKAKLTKNLRGSRSITSYLNDMRALADDLALAQCPISDEDLTVYILNQLGEEYNSIISVVRVREKPISFGELADVLTDHERQLKAADETRFEFLPVGVGVTIAISMRLKKYSYLQCKWQQLTTKMFVGRM